MSAIDFEFNTESTAIIRHPVIQLDCELWVMFLTRNATGTLAFRRTYPHSTYTTLHTYRVFSYRPIIRTLRTNHDV